MKRILWALLLWPSLALAQTPIIGGVDPTTGIVNITRGSTVGSDSTNSNFAGSEDTNRTVFASAGVLDKLYVTFTNAPGAGTSRTIALRKNGVTTALACTIADAATTCNNTSDTVSISAGDTGLVLTTNSGAAAATTAASWGFRFTPTTANETFLTTSFLFNGAGFGQIPDGRVLSPSASESNVTMFVGAGTFGALYMSSNAGAGAGKDYVFTTRTNSSNTTQTCSITGSGTGPGVSTCNDTTHTFTTAENDTVDIGLTSVSGTPAAINGTLGLRFTPTVAGNFYLSGGASAGDSSVNTVYLTPSGRINATTTTEANAVQTAPMSFWLSKMYISSSAAPGVGKSRTFTLRVNGVGTGLTCSLSGAGSTTCNVSSSNGIALSAGDTFTIQDAPTGNPSAGTVRTLLIAQNTPPGTPNGLYFMSGGL